MKHREAVAAVVLHEGKILCVQNGDGKRAYEARKYEFPGGKIEAGETEQEAVVREMMEELAMPVSVGRKLLVVDHTYPDVHITMHVYLCSCENPRVTLTEHSAYQWLAPGELRKLDWAEAEWGVVGVVESFTHF